jgi:hypothetical protein
MTSCVALRDVLVEAISGRAAVMERASSLARIVASGVSGVFEPSAVAPIAYRSEDGAAQHALWMLNG